MSRRKREVSEFVRKKVAAKLAGMVRFHDRKEVAKKLGIHYITLCNLISGRYSPSKAMATMILGEERNAKKAKPAEVPTTIACPHCNGTGLQHSESVQAGNRPGRRVRSKPVPAPASNVPDLPRQGHVNDVVPVAKEEKVRKLPKFVVAELELQNKARILANLSTIKVKVVRCVGCRELFESTGNRICPECKDDPVTVLSGREVY